MEKQFSLEKNPGQEALKIGDRVRTTVFIGKSRIHNFSIKPGTPGIIVGKGFPNDWRVRFEIPSQPPLEIGVNNDEIERIPDETLEEKAAA